TVQTAVETVEARAGIREADAGTERFQRPHLEAAAVVADLHPETLADTPRADVNVVAAVPARDAVLDRVLDERLQDHPRHFAVERVGFDRHADSETILEARLFDVEVLLQELGLFLQRHLRLAAAIERDAEQIAQPADHSVGGIRIAVHERGNGVQRVEQEVRVQLRLERLEARLDDLRLELRGAQLPLLRLVIEGDRVADAHDD